MVTSMLAISMSLTTRLITQPLKNIRSVSDTAAGAHSATAAPAAQPATAHAQ